MEPEELGDPGLAGQVEALERFREVLEPLKAPRVRGRGGREGLGVGGEWVLSVAGLREELGVLLEDLEVFLFFWGWLVFFLRFEKSAGLP